MLILRILFADLLLHTVNELVRPVDIDEGALHAWSAPHDAFLAHVDVGTWGSLRLLCGVNHKVHISWVLKRLWLWDLVNVSLCHLFARGEYLLELFLLSVICLGVCW